MSRYQTITDLAVDDALPESWVDAVRINVSHLTVAGADLTSGSTINVTASFHKVTGTSTINNIVDTSGATKGQPLRLWFSAPLQLTHNGGGAGQLNLQGASNKAVSANSIVSFAYDSAGDQWVELASPHVSLMSQLAADVTLTTPGTFYDGPTLSLTPGTWVLMASLQFAMNNRVITAKIWDGASSTVVSLENGVSGAVQGFLTLVGRVVITAGATYKASATAAAGSATMLAAAATNGAGNNASTLVAIRMA